MKGLRKLAVEKLNKMPKHLMPTKAMSNSQNRALNQAVSYRKFKSKSKPTNHNIYHKYHQSSRPDNPHDTP